MIQTYVFLSPLGKLKAIVKDRNVISFSFADDSTSVFEDDSYTCKAIHDWIDEYFIFRIIPETKVPLSITGTPFQIQVYQTILNIPYGKSICYGDIQAELEKNTGKKISCQAIGQALKKNPILLFVPCHRVLKKGGFLSGYAGGRDRKRYLLELEKIPFVFD